MGTKRHKPEEIVAKLRQMDVLALAVPADAKGCIKGAIVGGAAGSMAGHGKAGAAAGCAIGHHKAAEKDQQRSEQGQ